MAIELQPKNIAQKFFQGAAHKPDNSAGDGGRRYEPLFILDAIQIIDEG